MNLNIIFSLLPQNMRFELSNSQDITNIFIIIIVIFLICCLIRLISQYIRYTKNISTLTSNINKYCDEFMSQGNAPFHDVNFQKFYNGLIWRKTNNNEIKIFNTIPTEETLSDEALANNLCGPQSVTLFITLLTGFGVLGTFLGLTIGLQDLTFNGTSTQIIEQIKTMTGCASTAFITSVYGVLSGLIVNIARCILWMPLNKKILKLRNILDGKYPLISTVDDFMNSVKDELKSSKDLLGGLAEEIGQRMQEHSNSLSNSIVQGLTTELKEFAEKICESINNQTNNSNLMLNKTLDHLTALSNIVSQNISDNVCEGIKTSITEAMQPAINDLVKASNEMTDKNYNSSTNMLEKLLERFMNEIGKVGSSQREDIELATTNLRDALQENITKTKEIFDSIILGQQSQTQNVQTQSLEIMNKINNMLESQQNYTEKLSNILNNHQESSANVITGAKDMQSAFNNNIETLEIVSSDFSNLCDCLKDSCKNISEMKESLKYTIKEVESNIVNSLATSNKFLEGNKILQASFSDITNKLETVGTNFEKTSNTFSQVATSSNSQFENLAKEYNELKTKIDNSITNLNEQVHGLMINYNKNVEELIKSYGNQVSTQTSERLREWDKETRNFCESMENVISVIRDLVDEIDDKRK